MKFWVGITDGDWFEYLSAFADLDEVNFWQPGGQRLFRSLQVGEPFLFKLHSPRNFIVGGGFFSHATLLPSSLAWETFREKNGAATLDDMRERIERYRRAVHDPAADYAIGCVLLSSPFFFQEQDWIPVPADFHRNIVQGKGYDTREGAGSQLWDRVTAVLHASKRGLASDGVATRAGGARYGGAVTIFPRLGQGTFRIMVADSYDRRCAVTRERALPALEAAHIKPYSRSGRHRVDNGLFLRRDLHGLFDSGYVTVTNDYRVEVSRRIHEDFQNGEHYRLMHGKRIWLPRRPDLRPRQEFLQYHQDRIFRG